MLGRRAMLSRSIETFGMSFKRRSNSKRLGSSSKGGLLRIILNWTSTLP
jgi:hypothetical protein